MCNMWDNSLVRFHRRSVLAGLGGALLLPSCRTVDGAEERLLHRDEFRTGLGQWLVEAERGGSFSATDGILDVDSPAGATLWFGHA